MKNPTLLIKNVSINSMCFKSCQAKNRCNFKTLCGRHPQKFNCFLLKNFLHNNAVFLLNQSLSAQFLTTIFRTPKTKLQKRNLPAHPKLQKRSQMQQSKSPKRQFLLKVRFLKIENTLVKQSLFYGVFLNNLFYKL